MSQRFDKDPDAVLDYQIDWSDFLDDDTISTSTWEANDDDITIEASPAPSHANGITTVWLSGGTLGTRYELTNHIVTAAGREDDRTITVRIVQK